MGHVKTVAAFGLRQRMLDRYLEILKLEGKQDRKRSVATSFASAYNSAVSFLMFGGVIFIANLFINRGWIEPKDVLQVADVSVPDATGRRLVALTFECFRFRAFMGGQECGPSRLVTGRTCGIIFRRHVAPESPAERPRRNTAQREGELSLGPHSPREREPGRLIGVEPTGVASPIFAMARSPWRTLAHTQRSRWGFVKSYVRQ